MQKQKLYSQSGKIKDTLKSFKISVEMKKINVGPSVIKFVFQLESGVKISKLMSYKDDLKLCLGVKALEINQCDNYIAVEIPNPENVEINLKDILGSDVYKSLDSPLNIALGCDMAGNYYFVDLNKVIHLLIAGTTGSGKSTGLHSFIVSLIYQNGPADLRFVLIDTKHVEFSLYDRLPHLLTPVLNDPVDALSALKQLVVEMERRYELLAKNKVVYIDDLKVNKPPRIVVIIDELADLVMSNKDILNDICRLAQKARAVGIHLIVATQRPSVDVIDGKIKANFPSRLSYAVNSGVDSRLIIGESGAENLKGFGDSIFIPFGSKKRIRLQGAYISKDDLKKLFP